MKYFITGATGFIGGKLARRLVADGHEVIALVRTPSKATELEKLGIQLAKGDITDKASMRDPMQGVDGVFHVAAWYFIGQRDSSMAQTINVEGTRNVLKLMQELQIPKGVYTSTLAVFGDTHGRLMTETDVPDSQHFLSEYDRTKWAAHYQVALPMSQQGLPLVTVLPGAVYGIGDQSDLHNIWVQYLQRKLPIIPKGFTICWAHVDDIVEGHILAMTHGKLGEAYIIAGEPKALEEVLAFAQTVTGVPAPTLKAPPALLKASAALMGVLEKVIPLPAVYTKEGLAVSAGTTYLGDNSKAKRELGYNPRLLSAGLPEVLHYEMEQLGMQPKA